MRAVNTYLTTATLGAPSDWDGSYLGDCEGLPVCVVGDNNFSYWKPTLKDKLNILMGRNVRLCVFGAGHPPVSLDTEI